ncbi:MAG: RsmG family class I SAM-dependent methyltransferase [Leptospiraceae bacterium]|nr:RsmG family class I SAM-dependent methyltransferase [Leptospiraceae bacterium]
MSTNSSDEVKNNLLSLSNINQSIWNLDLIVSYYHFLKEKNLQGGFFSNSEEEHILTRHVYESMIHVEKLAEKISISRETKIADVGTGPGLPGFLFLCLKERPNVTLIDSQQKRLKLLYEFTREVKIRLEVIYERAELIHKKFQLATMRSVVPYPWSIEIVSKLVSNNGYFAPFLAKRNYPIEFEEKFLTQFGFEIFEDFQITELKFLGERHIKLLKKKAIVEQSFVRPWAVIQKEIREYNGKNNFNQ